MRRVSGAAGNFALVLILIGAGGCGAVIASTPDAHAPASLTNHAQPQPCFSSTHVQEPLFGEPCTATSPAAVVARTDYDYPRMAREANVDGTVVVSVLVCEHGRVRQTRVVRSIPMLDAEAEACVREWTFSAAMSGGNPVPCWIDVPVTFSLK
jgi:TonB family protein